MPRISKAITVDRALLVVVGVAAIGAFLITQRDWLQYGPLVAWVAGALAAVAAVVSWNSWQDTRAKIADDHASQARLVLGEYRALDHGYKLRVRNYSESLLLHADVSAFNIDGNDASERVFEHFTEPVPDSHGDEVLLPHTDSIWHEFPNLRLPFRYVLSYTDARGVKWTRVVKEQPERIVDAPNRSR